MKSLGPYAYTNENHPKKPTHISSAISEVLNQVGTTAKPTPGASMPEKQPEKGPERSTHKANSSEHPEGNDITKQFDPPPAKPQSPNEPPPARSPGRPRLNRIESFNTDTYLRQNRKFIKLKKKLGISEEKTWTIITSMFCYVAQSEALTPVIDDVELFAEFCYWDDDPQILIKALISVNFITSNYQITGWFQNQPHAARKLHNYKHYEDKKEQ